MRNLILLILLCVGFTGFTQTPAGYVNVKTLGVSNDGRDITKVLQNAANSGKPLFFPAGKYLISKTIHYNGKLSWKGAGNTTVILCDDIVFEAEHANNSKVDNIRFQNITTPWALIRDEVHIGGKYRLARSNTVGYQPTLNDSDVWPKLTAAQQQQDIGPKLYFSKTATNIQVSRVYGNFVSILFDSAVNSTVSNCNFKGGKNAFGAIRFANLAEGKGKGNKAINNTITYASFCGVVFIGNTNGTASGNTITGSGESGIKLYQGVISGYDARCAQMTITNNTTKYNIYDGLDLTTNGPRTPDAITSHTVTGNHALYNGGAGIYADGSGNLFSGNTVAYNYRSGIEAFVKNSRFLKNKVTDNNVGNAPAGVHEISIAGAGNTILENVIARNKARNGYAIYATEANDVERNSAKGAGFFFGQTGKIKAKLLNNTLTK
jgi:parallel beta-helix repeat protein